ncbi:MAG: glycosyltransferase family 4 protein [Longimicrobiales bacterium]
MRIGVDGGTWASGRGYGRFTREILSVMVRLAADDEWIVFLDPEGERAFDLGGGNVRTVTVGIEAPGTGASAEGSRAPADLLRLTRAVRRERPDVFFSPSVYTFFPLPPGQRAVVTVHDTIPERFPELTLPTRRARWFWNAKVRLALLQSRLVLTVSEYSARDIAAILGVPRERIRVAAEAPAEEYRPSDSVADIGRAVSTWGLTSDDAWFVYVGGFNPHKRVDAVVRAHAEVAQGRSRPPHLLLVGDAAGDRFHRNVDQIRDAIATSGTSGLVHWTGFVDDEVLRYVHAGAVGLVLVSEAEGFGLPAVEAAACGTPVIATRQSPLPEILEGGGIFLDPGDHAGLVRAMQHLLDDPVARSTMGARARTCANALTWERGASVALAALREASA